jgi:uncharacterized protein
MRALPLRLSPGADLRRALEAAAAAQGVEAAFVLQGMGSLADASLRLAGDAAPTLVAGASELLTLAGSVAPGASHLHACVADASGRVVGGHVPYGCRVRTTAELLLVLLPEWRFERAPDAATGFSELVIQPR